MSLAHYDRFIFWCDPGSREYFILKNGFIVRRQSGDHFERIMEILCTVEEALALLDRAKELGSDALPDIEKALVAQRAS